MTAPAITIEATLQPDGVTLRLDKRTPFAPGRVIVTVQSVASSSGQAMLEVLDRIHREQQQRGRPATTEEEMAAGIAAMRSEDDEYEERCRRIWSQTQPPNTAEKP